ncbi:hypothetical protein PLESTF_000533600 [Pleodorina starrii]|nr:hypothetical protein PLESTF_000533600 [Pleodorina starrii]
MAQQKASGFSSKVLGLRFMQRAAEKRKLEEDAAAATAASLAAEAANGDGVEANASQAAIAVANEPAWPQPSTSGRCVITYEPVPLPGFASRSGRMSFGPNVGSAQPSGEGSKAGTGPAAAAASGSQPSVSDADMAKTFRKPSEMRAWQPSNLRIFDAPEAPGGAVAGGGGTAAAAAGGGGDGDGGAAAAAGKPSRQSGDAGAGGKRPGSKGPGLAAAQASAQPSNSFAPLRPPKRAKLN